MKSQALEQAKLEMNLARSAHDRGNVNLVLLHGGRALLHLGEAVADTGGTEQINKMSDEVFGWFADVGERWLQATTDAASLKRSLMR